MVPNVRASALKHRNLKAKEHAATFLRYGQRRSYEYVYPKNKQ